ncbi:MAG: peptide chain release factor N(5)-glutamine methyltransferase [Bacteroidaceae bacterium]
MQPLKILHSIAETLSTVYPPNEAKAIARIVVEDYLEISMLDLYAGKVNQICGEKQQELHKMLERLRKKEPVQYVVGKALFMGYAFDVTPAVLIPRPETEELVNWVTSDVQQNDAKEPVRLVDIGTGSGCIAILLAKRLRQANVTGWDLSDAALSVAKANAKRLKVDVAFEQRDVLQPVPELPLKYNVIVSNPPYICQCERQSMERNVTDYEPSLALFVADDDPLVFYRAIAQLGQKALAPNGTIYFEINERFGNETAALLKQEGYHAIELRKDSFGRHRMLKAII